jgi:hypothetical protein
MLPGKLLVIGVTASALMFAGCGKKKNNSISNPSQTSSKTATSQTSTPKSAESDDIFNEFYKDDNAGNQKEKVSAKETFTPSGTSSFSGTYQPSFSSSGRYVLQISTVRSGSFADKLKGKLEKAGYPAYVAEVQNPTPALSGTYYRIRVGAFATISAAKEFGENVLKSLGYEYWVDNKANDLVGIDGGSFGNSGNSYNSNSYAPSTPAPSPATSEWEPSSSQTQAPAQTSSHSNSGSTSATSASASSSTIEPGLPATSTGSTLPASSSSLSTTPTRDAPAAAIAQPTSTPSSSNTGSSAAKKDSVGWGTSGW